MEDVNASQPHVATTPAPTAGAPKPAPTSTSGANAAPRPTTAPKPPVVPRPATAPRPAAASTTTPASNAAGAAPSPSPEAPAPASTDPDDSPKREQAAPSEPSAAPSGKASGPKIFKENSARNSTVHGIYAQKAHLLPSEDPAAFEALRDDLHTGYKPQGAAEQLLVDRLALAIFKSNRVNMLETQGWALLLEQNNASYVPAANSATGTGDLQVIDQVGFMRTLAANVAYDMSKEQFIRKLRNLHVSVTRDIRNALDDLEKFRQSRTHNENGIGFGEAEVTEV